MIMCLGVGVLDSALYAVGGHDGPLVRKSVEAYDPESNTWRQVADMHLCRRNAGNYSTIFNDCFVVKARVFFSLGLWSRQQTISLF